MIPLRIAVRNFGAIPEADIDLRNVDLAAIVGPNGVGKSTLFTAAPMFALFGATKGDGPDTIVRTGESEASVTLEFEHRGDLYRVTRTRSTSGRGKSSLELMKLVTEGGRYAYEPLTGTTIKETEEKIRDLINLDAETFAASAMILQGKADEFTAKPAGQRKAILAQVLGLEIYDKLQAASRDKAKRLAAEMDTLKATLSRLEEELATKGDVIAEKARIETEIGTVRVELIQTKTDAQTAQDAFASAKGDIESLKEKSDNLTALSDEIQGYEPEAEGLRSKIDVAEKLLNRETEIITADDTRKLLLAEQRTTSEKRETLTRMNQDLAKVRAAITAAETERDQIRARIEASDRVIDGRMSALAAKKEIDELTARQGDMSKRREDHLAVQVKIDSMREKIRVAEEQVSILANSHCVAPEKAEKAPCRFLEGAITARNALPEMEGRIKVLIAEQVGINYSESLFEAAKKRILEVKPLADKLPAIEAQVQVRDTLRQSWQQADNAILDARERGKSLTKDIAELTAALAGSDEINSRIEALNPVADLRDKLPQAHADKLTCTDRLAWISQRISAITPHVKQLTADVEQLKGRLAGGIGDLQAQAARTANALSVKESDLNVLHSQLGAINARIEALTKAEAEAQGIKGKVTELQAGYGQWAQLVRAFGKDGIPALIIENAVPELERASNEILSRMTGGKHSLRFETQRGLKSKAGIAETLDIIVADWQGERQYETFSGGEQLRINFAIRFALAELLAMRAGSRVEWLTIDEGIGSQDREHRDLVLESIRNVADRFKKVMVITHVEEAQGFFPQQVSFSRNGEKVEVEVA